MNEHPYADPIRKLLDIGRPDEPWPDYPSVYGLSEADIPELIRLLGDHDLRWQEEPDDEAEAEAKTDWYAQIHAWRALGQLKALEAIPALLGILPQIDETEDDWLQEEAEDVFELLGPPSVEPLCAYLEAAPRLIYACGAVGGALEQLAKRYPETRSRCLQAIVTALQDYQNNDESLNAFFIVNLVELQAVEQIDLIEQAFQAEMVDEMVMGDFEDIQMELGLLEKRKTPAHNYFRESFLPGKSPTHSRPQTPKPQRSAEQKKKAKQKQEKRSRKKNRKKK